METWQKALLVGLGTAGLGAAFIYVYQRATGMEPIPLATYPLLLVPPVISSVILVISR
jgi:hypothetical protein